MNQAAVAAARVLPESAESTEEFMASFVSRLVGPPPATEDAAAVKPHEALAAESEAKRNAQVSSVGFTHSKLHGWHQQLPLPVFKYTHISHK